MTRQQKHAWFNLAVVGATAALVLGLYPFLGFRALGALGFMGLLGGGPLFYRRPKHTVDVVWDERDREIQLRAGIISYSIFWVLFVGACMAVWFLRRQEGTVPVIVLPLMVFGGWLLQTLAHSVATLVQYGSEAGNGAE